MAIIKPNEMDFSNKNFSMIISGSPGIGKTTLALSAPEPILIDFDKGVSRVKAQHRRTTIICTTYEEIKKDLQAPEVCEAKSIIIDTGGSFVTYLQDWAMRSNPTSNKQKNGAISLKGFGAVKSEFVSFTNMLQYTMNKNIIYIFHTVEEKDGEQTKQRLLCEGAARNLVWQPCDLGCNMHMIGNERVLGFTPTEEYFAKGCFGISGVMKLPTLDADTKNDFLVRLFEKARSNIAEEAKIYEVEAEAYNEVIKRASQVIESIKNIDDAQNVSNEIKTLSHALTSEKEIRTMFLQKIDSIGIKYSKEAGGYVKVSDDTIIA